jgi:hypothetical protein
VFSSGEVGVGGINGPRPITTTLLTLDGQINTEPPFEGTKIIAVSSTTDFLMYPGQTSAPQDIFITNEGSAPLSLVLPYIFPTQDGANFNFVEFEPNNGVTPEPIPPGGTGTLTVSYTAGSVEGEYYNWFVIFTDADNPQYKVVTKQVISNSFDFNLSTSSYTTSTTRVGERSQFIYQLIPIFNGNEVEDSITFSVSISGSPGWKILSTGTNQFTVEFESNDINNSTGTYVAGVTVTSGDASFVVNNTANVNINFDNNKNFVTWASPKAPDNSVIGISYDLIDGKKTLTIGVGMGGDGTPVYAEGGDLFYNLDVLGVGGNNLDFPYSGWAEVYRFTDIGTGTVKTLLSGAIGDDSEYLYRQKVTDSRDYGYYFGQGNSLGSMFTVEDLGNGDLRIYLNNIREFSGDETFDGTLNNLTRAFHYYSPVDVGGRIENIVQYPFETSAAYPVTNSTIPVPPGETRTKMFIGFNSKTATTFDVITSLVEIPS